MQLRNWIIITILALPASALGQIARPTESPGNWIGNKDYPRSALRALEEGTVAFKLDVDVTGAPTGCAVVSSSGSRSLDQVTCQVLMKRSTFMPPVDENGKSTKGYFSSRILWVLPFPNDIDPEMNYVGIIGRDEEHGGRTQVVVDKVFSGPGLQAGFKPNDVILQVGNHSVSNFADFVRIIALIPIGTTYMVTVDRRQVTVPLTVRSQSVPPEGTAERYAVKRQMWEAYFRR